MAAKIIDGKKLAPEIRTELAGRVEALKTQFSVTPGSAIVLVGDDTASKVYVSNKTRACAAVGIHSIVHRLDHDVAHDTAIVL